MWLALGLVCLMAPVDGPVVEPYAPAGAYAGHWGVDFAAVPGTVVVSPLDGRVSFAGSVAGMLTVTIETGDLKVSVSYLSGVLVTVGEEVSAGAPIARSGSAHGTEALHLSTRIGGRYVDPAPFLACAFRPLSEALRLVPYPGVRANRTPGRNFRPASSGSPPHRRGGVSSARPGRRHVHAGRSPVAEGGPERLVTRAPVGHDPSRRPRRRLLRGR